MKLPQTTTSWKLSLFCNSIAVGLSTLAAIWYTHWKYHIKNKESPQTKTFLSKYDLIIAGTLSTLTALTIYSIIYYIFGYLPMGKVQETIISNKRTPIKLLKSQIKNLKTHSSITPHIPPTKLKTQFFNF